VNVHSLCNINDQLDIGVVVVIGASGDLRVVGAVSSHSPVGQIHFERV
jgi:hypothetical protein